MDKRKLDNPIDIVKKSGGLFCLNGQGYEERCQMVADWIKEASHEST